MSAAPIPVSHQGYAATATFTPAAAAYSANDVMSVAQELANIGPQGGGEVTLTSLVMQTAHTALVAAEADYNLHLYNVTPPSAHADNAAWDLPAGDRLAHIATINIPVAVDVGSSLHIEKHGMNIQVTIPAGGSLFAELVTVAGITATAAARKVTLHSRVL